MSSWLVVDSGSFGLRLGSPNTGSDSEIPSFLTLPPLLEDANDDDDYFPLPESLIETLRPRFPETDSRGLFLVSPLPYFLLEHASESRSSLSGYGPTRNSPCSLLCIAAFETGLATEFYHSTPLILGQYACARVTGLGLDLGETSCRVGAIYEGSLMLRTCCVVPELSSRQLTTPFGSYLPPGTPTAYAYHLKHNAALLEHLEEEDTTFSLPDDSEITLSVSQRTQPASNLFFNGVRGSDFNRTLNPRGSKITTIPSLLRYALHHSFVDLRQDLRENVTFMGGGARLRGLDERIVRAEGCDGLQILGREAMDRTNAAVVGASVLCSLSSFEESMAVTKEEYDDCGASVLQRKDCVSWIE